MSIVDKDVVGEHEIDECITILEKLVKDGSQIFELSEEKRVALIKAAGRGVDVKLTVDNQEYGTNKNSHHLTPKFVY